MSRLGLIVGSALLGAEPALGGDVVPGFDPVWRSRVLEAELGAEVRL